MTRKEAVDIIARIAADEIELFRPRHFWESLNKRGFTLHDLRAILRSHQMEAAPEWFEEHSEFRVRLIGRCLEGRRTRLVLGLRQGGPCTCVTIMEVR